MGARIVLQRVQFLARPGAKHRYERTARAAGLTLSEWLRRVADSAAGEDPEKRQLRTRADLEAFFRRHNALVAAISPKPRSRP